MKSKNIERSIGMKTVQMLKGLPGCGKTTYAREKVSRDNNWVRVNKDDIRKTLFCNQSNLQEKIVVQAEDDLIRFFMNKNKNIIVDDTNFNPHHHRRLQTIVDNYNKGKATEDSYRLDELFFDISIETCLERNALREGLERVPDHVILEMYSKYLGGENKEIIKDKMLLNDLSKFIVQNESLPHVILCDIDGCIALMGDRSPFEWNKVHLDKPNPPVRDLIDLLWYCEDAPHIIFMSGRSDECRELTEQWLRAHTAVSYPELYMRKAGDNRKDSIVKEELYREHIQPNYYVDFILDDRNQVVEMWRSLGLTCFQVAEGNF